MSVDGAYTTENVRGGVVIRDYDGEVKALMVARLDGVVDAGHAEVMAIWYDFRLAKELLVSGIIVESDCLHLI